MLGERIASQSEVIRALVSGYGPCCGFAHHYRVGVRLSKAPPDVVQREDVAVGNDLIVPRSAQSREEPREC